MRNSGMAAEELTPARGRGVRATCTIGRSYGRVKEDHVTVGEGWVGISVKGSLGPRRHRREDGWDLLSLRGLRWGAGSSIVVVRDRFDVGIEAFRRHGSINFRL
ncbi:hypothetical protein L484_019300 [Morus notabilis]|uniref:Uncharacterized protein n=1 Tax=Morus notabilis TaxID=981085 RepID=W9RRW4_9ROSA|nr:hypothetical protein L484_019300 [Morus notabilis]